MPIAALFDACVLYPATLRDLLMHLARTDVFQARWTEAIHDEWTRNLLKNRPDISPERLNRTRELMNQAVPDCLIDGFEKLVGSFHLPDPNDEHILAAAVDGNVDVIVTWNIKHFPGRILAAYQVRVENPDDFITAQFLRIPEIAVAAVKQQRAAMNRPPVTVDGLLTTFQSLGLKKTVKLLRQFESGL